MMVLVYISLMMNNLIYVFICLSVSKLSFFVCENVQIKDLSALSDF